MESKPCPASKETSEVKCELISVTTTVRLHAEAPSIEIDKNDPQAKEKFDAFFKSVTSGTDLDKTEV